MNCVSHRKARWVDVNDFGLDICPLKSQQWYQNENFHLRRMRRMGMKRILSQPNTFLREMFKLEKNNNCVYFTLVRSHILPPVKMGGSQGKLRYREDFLKPRFFMSESCKIHTSIKRDMFVHNSTWGHVKIIYSYFRKWELDDFHWRDTSLQIYFLLNIYFSTKCLISMSVTSFSKGKRWPKGRRRKIPTWFS